MKSTINILRATAFMLATIVTLHTYAGDKYTEAMQKNINVVYTSQATADLQNAVNNLERIGGAEKTKWEPYYYASFGYIMMATQEKQSPNQKDTYLDQATSAIAKAKAIAPNDSEITALEGFIHMIRVTVDPASRGQQYSGLAMQSFHKAVAINPNNPRALALLAQMQFGTAQFFGSPVTEACSNNAKALELFAAEKPASEVAPVWGKGMAEGMVEKCK